MIKTGHAAKRLGVDVVCGFTGSSIWHLNYSFPAVPKSMIDDGYADFARRWKPNLTSIRNWYPICPRSASYRDRF